ncbi:hypothetical protein LTR95_000628 [Oleoguttula sp. CCFEE 5521]
MTRGRGVEGAQSLLVPESGRSLISMATFYSLPTEVQWHIFDDLVEIYRPRSIYQQSRRNFYGLPFALRFLLNNAAVLWHDAPKVILEAFQSGLRIIADRGVPHGWVTMSEDLVVEITLALGTKILAAAQGSASCQMRYENTFLAEFWPMTIMQQAVHEASPFVKRLVLEIVCVSRDGSEVSKAGRKKTWTKLIEGAERVLWNCGELLEECCVRIAGEMESWAKAVGEPLANLREESLTNSMTREKHPLCPELTSKEAGDPDAIRGCEYGKWLSKGRQDWAKLLAKMNVQIEGSVE